MKKILIVILVLLPLLSMAYDFEDGGVRNAALGDVGISSAQDASAAVKNPALLAYISRFSIITDTRHYSIQLDNDEIGQNFTYFAMPTRKYGTIALAGGMFNSNAYSEGKFGLHFGKQLLSGKLGLGLGVKTFYTDFSEINENKLAVDLDLGLAYKPLKNVNIGVIANNLLSTDIGINSEDRVPRVFGIGASSTYGRYTVAGDLKYKDDYDKSVLFSLGSEVNFADNFDIRAGINNSYYTSGFGLKIYEKSSLIKFNKKT
ncbi:MAG: hypothetical protein U9N34_08255, partial [Candidatus Cloacimonadota bacterium]|nr:hypothetical protein [Candidatus Cloacimonadota bacterium]